MSGLVWGMLYVFGAVLLLSVKLPYLKTFGLIGVVAMLAGLLFVESVGQKIYLRPLIGAIKILQGLINTMSDILSYSRLMALGLATAVIALIVNQIAEGEQHVLVRNLISLCTERLGIAIEHAGNIPNIPEITQYLLNIPAFLQSLRGKPYSDALQKIIDIPRYLIH